MSRLFPFLRRRAVDRELAEEMRGHIEESVTELVEAGMSREEAERRARVQFGNIRSLREESMDVWNFNLVDNLLRDLRIGARALRNKPLFTAVAITTLALGIGANVAVFSVINSVLLRKPPFHDADRIVMLWEVPPKIDTSAIGARKRQNPVSPVNFLDWQDGTHSFSAMSPLVESPMGLSGFGEPREVDSLEVSSDFFPILGVAPLLGRAFTREEDVPHGPLVAVLSYSLWQQQFGGDPTVLGRTVQLNAEPYRVIGVMPQSFDLPFAH